MWLFVFMYSKHLIQSNRSLSFIKYILKKISSMNRKPSSQYQKKLKTDLSGSIKSRNLTSLLLTEPLINSIFFAQLFLCLENTLQYRIAIQGNERQLLRLYLM